MPNDPYGKLRARSAMVRHLLRAPPSLVLLALGGLSGGARLAAASGGGAHVKAIASKAVRIASSAGDVLFMVPHSRTTGGWCVHYL